MAAKHSLDKLYDQTWRCTGTARDAGREQRDYLWENMQRVYSFRVRGSLVKEVMELSRRGNVKMCGKEVQGFEYISCTDGAGFCTDGA